MVSVSPALCVLAAFCVLVEGRLTRLPRLAHLPTVPQNLQFEIVSVKGSHSKERQNSRNCSILTIVLKFVPEL